MYVSKYVLRPYFSYFFLREITSLFDSSLDLDQSLAHRKAQQ